MGHRGRREKDIRSEEKERYGQKRTSNRATKRDDTAACSYPGIPAAEREEDWLARLVEGVTHAPVLLKGRRVVCRRIAGILLEVLNAPES